MYIWHHPLFRITFYLENLAEYNCVENTYLNITSIITYIRMMIYSQCVQLYFIRKQKSGVYNMYKNNVFRYYTQNLRKFLLLFNAF